MDNAKNPGAGPGFGGDAAEWSSIEMHIFVVAVENAGEAAE